MRKVFITGANSFIGQELCKRLLASGDEVHGLITHELEPKVSGVIGHQGNLLDFDVMEEILKEVNPEFIVHLAAKTEVEKSFYDPINFSSINYVGTVNLIEKAKNLSNLKLFLFASTMETYGDKYSKEFTIENPSQLRPFVETTVQFPNAPYAVAKLACEYYLKYAYRAYQFPFTAFRQTNTYGRHDNDFFVVEQFITQMLKNKDIVKFGYKDPWRNFLYIDDLIDLYLTVLDNPTPSIGEFFVTGPDNALRIEDLAKKIAEKVGFTGEIQWDQKPERVGEIYYLNSNPRKARQKLGWSPKVSLDEGLERTIQLWRSNLSL